jgi:hypothetical protein
LAVKASVRERDSRDPLNRVFQGLDEDSACYSAAEGEPDSMHLDQERATECSRSGYDDGITRVDPHLF